MPPAAQFAAVLITRNESRCINRCLESVRPFVDHILVLDTGSQDDTVALANSAGAQVHHFDWTDDFSAARNHALTLANADWSLVIDADESIASGGEELRQWCAGPPRIGALCQHNSFDREEASLPGAPLPESRIWVPRILPRGVRYEGRVHEQPVSDLPHIRTPLHLHHDGYLEAQKARKQGRNLPLLLQELAAHPDDPYLLYQIGTEAESRKDHAQASQFYSKSRTLTPPQANWRHAMLIRLLHCLGQSGQSEQALRIAEEEIAHWQHSPDFFFVLGNLLLKRAIADPVHALQQWLPLAETAWEQCLAIGEQPDLEGSVAGRGSHLASHNLAMLREQKMLLSA